MSAEITNQSAFKEGSLGIQVALFVVTFGFYGLYWMYDVATQLDAGTNADITPILTIIPVYGAWLVADGSEAVTDQSNVILFVLFVVFAPAAWFLIQSGINDIATTA